MKNQFTHSNSAKSIDKKMVKEPSDDDLMHPYRVLAPESSKNVLT